MNAIELIGLTKRFGNRIAVNDLNLEVFSGDIFGFVGPNGSGKTTTIRMIAGLLKPVGGQAFIQGFSVQENPEEVKKRIGYMPDYFGVYPDLKVWEYLDFFGACYKIDEEKRKTLIDELLDLVDLSHRRDDIVDRLSRGLKQRLSLARTLIHDPQVLILDEPAAGLDPRARIEIRELMVELAHMGKTIFFSTHILSDVSEICSRIGIIEEGRLVASGKLEELHFLTIPHRRIEITLLDRLSTALSFLMSIPLISKIESTELQPTNGRHTLSFEFEGDDQALSSILKDLVSQDIPVLHFREDERDLEAVFLRATKGIVS